MRSSIVTIGPIGLFCLLAVTFYVGARPVRRAPTGGNLSGDPSTASTRTTRAHMWGRTSDSSMSSRATTSSRGLSAGGARERDAEASSAFPSLESARNKEPVPGREGQSPPVSPGPRARAIGSSQRSVRSVWKTGPGDESNAEQVGGCGVHVRGSGIAEYKKCRWTSCTDAWRPIIPSVPRKQNAARNARYYLYVQIEAKLNRMSAALRLPAC